MKKKLIEVALPLAASEAALLLFDLLSLLKRPGGLR
jgi:hypothetical protein